MSIKDTIEKAVDKYLEEDKMYRMKITPTGDLSWYIKWVSMILAVSGIFLISASYLLYGQVAYLISSVGWIYVGMQWGDRAIMIGSAISATAVAMILIENPLLFSQLFG